MRLEMHWACPEKATSITDTLGDMTIKGDNRR